jgi:hypothetical protein
MNRSGVLRPKRTWRTWDEPDRQVAVAQWVERNISVVFPLTWAAHHGQPEMIARAKERIAEVEGKAAAVATAAGNPARELAPGSVLLAFSRHDITLREPCDERRLNPEVIADLRSANPALDPSGT